MNNHGDGTQSYHGMKAKTIRMILRKKVNAWLDSIEDEELRKACQREAIVTGGSIASMLLGEEVNDFDIYFRTKETVKRVADYYVAKFQESKICWCPWRRPARRLSIFRGATGPRSRGLSQRCI